MAVCGKCIHKNVCGFCKEMGFEDVVRANDFNCKDYLPEADVAEVKHGEWLRQNGGFFFLCSVCGKAAATKGKYCHDCGTQMDGGS